MRNIAKEQGSSACLPVIGIVPSYNSQEKQVCVPDRYVKSITRAGGAPLLLPLSGDSRVYETLFPLVDGFVLTGGNDIDPARYGAIADSGKISEHTPVREDLEYLILSYARRYDLPLLGICRGMQMINVCFGGTLYRDLGDQFGGIRRAGLTSDVSELPKLAHWQQPPYDEPTHLVDINLDSRLGKLIGTTPIEVNSMHHQGVCEVAPILDAVAYGADGLVEAVEVRDRSFMIGVQWHPEFFAENGTEHRMSCVFYALIKAAAKKHAAKRGSVAISRSEQASGDSSTNKSLTVWPDITFADYI